MIAGKQRGSRSSTKGDQAMASMDRPTLRRLVLRVGAPLVIALCALVVPSLAQAAAAPAWRLISVTGPTNLPPFASEIQRLLVNAEGGTFTLRFEGQETVAIPFDAPPAEVADALRGAPLDRHGKRRSRRPDRGTRAPPARTSSASSAPWPASTCRNLAPNLPGSAGRGTKRRSPRSPKAAPPGRQPSPPTRPMSVVRPVPGR